MMMLDGLESSERSWGKAWATEYVLDHIQDTNHDVERDIALYNKTKSVFEVMKQGSEAP